MKEGITILLIYHSSLFPLTFLSSSGQVPLSRFQGQNEELKIQSKMTPAILPCLDRMAKKRSRCFCARGCIGKRKLSALFSCLKRTDLLLRSEFQGRAHPFGQSKEDQTRQKGKRTVPISYPIHLQNFRDFLLPLLPTTSKFKPNQIHRDQS